MDPKITLKDLEEAMKEHEKFVKMDDADRDRLLQYKREIERQKRARET